MPRTARKTPGGLVYHVLNRGVRRMTLFASDQDYEAFENALEETWALCPIRLCGYCLMPNHWHLVVWPEEDGMLSRFIQRLSITHAARWQRNRHAIGDGHVYQGRYKAFPVSESHFTRVLRYVERNALRANLVPRAEDWHWSSLWRRLNGGRQHTFLLSDGPIPLDKNWVDRVNEAFTPVELTAVRTCVERNVPYGPKEWVKKTADDLGWSFTGREVK